MQKSPGPFWSQVAGHLPIFNRSSSLKDMIKNAIILIFVLLTLTATSSHAQSSSMPCYEPFSTLAALPGLIGTSCQASKIGDSERLIRYYEPFAFPIEEYVNHSQPEDVVRKYMDQILALIEQLATDYYSERAALEGRTYSAAELKGWLTAVLAVAYQESLMTQLQWSQRQDIKKEKLQTLVGDAQCNQKWQVKDGVYYCPEFKVNPDGKKMYGSIGLFQILVSIHSRNHRMGFYDLVQNINYGVIFSYSIWRKVRNGTHPNLDSCRDQIFTPNKKIDYVNMARSMYSAYNGGSARVCRWTQDTIWKRNDLGYYRQLINKPWESLASSEKAREARKITVKKPDGTIEKRHKFSFDLKCLREGRALCLQSEQSDVYLNTVNLNAPYCIWSDADKNYLCLDNEVALRCLQKKLGRFNKESSMAYQKKSIKKYREFKGSELEICSQFLPEIKMGLMQTQKWPALAPIYNWASAQAPVQHVSFYDENVKIKKIEINPEDQSVWYQVELESYGRKILGWGRPEERLEPHSLRSWATKSNEPTISVEQLGQYLNHQNVSYQLRAVQVLQDLPLTAFNFSRVLRVLENAFDDQVMASALALALKYNMNSSLSSYQRAAVFQVLLNQIKASSNSLAVEEIIKVLPKLATEPEQHQQIQNVIAQFKEKSQKSSEAQERYELLKSVFGRR